MGSPAPSEASTAARRRQRTVVELGRQALGTDDLDSLLADATSSVASTLDVEYCSVFERLPEGDEYLVRAGSGWRAGVVGSEQVSAAVDAAFDGAPSPEGFQRGPDAADAAGLEDSELLASHDVESGVVVEVGPGDAPWGVLGAFTRDARTFTDEEVDFLRAVANVLASAVETEYARAERDEIYGRISDAFFALDDEWRFTYINERADELINPDGRTLVGKDVWEEFPEAIGRSFKPKYERAMFEQETVAFEEYYPEPLDRWFEVRAYPSETGLSVYFRDVTARKEHERRLERSEQRYRALAEHVPNGLVTLFDDDLRYTLAAGQAFEEFEFSREDIEGKTVQEAWGEEVVDQLEPVLEAALAGEKSTVELAWGAREWRIYGIPVRDADDDVFAGMTMAQDITEQKERERYLQDRKAQLEAATEAGAVGTWEWKIPEDEFVAGAQFAEKFGVDPAAAQAGVPLDRFVSAIHDADVDRVEAGIKRAVENCGEYKCEYRVRDANGDLRWVVARGHVECDEEGNALTFPGALTDVTERKRYQQRLEENERRYRTLAENFPDGIVALFDEEFRFQAVGGQLFDEVEISPDDPVGETIHQRYPPDLLEEVEPYFESAIQGERTVFEVSRDGRHLKAYTLPVRNDDGEVFSGMLVVQDITERTEYQRKLEETIERLEESNERLEQFAYAASHDLQEPLRMVSSYLQLIERRYGDQLDEDGLEFLAFAVDGADRMRDMIDALLKYSRVETEGEQLEPVALDDVLADVHDDLSVKISERDAEVDVEPLPVVEGDGRQLRQVFQNLLDNAIEYTEEGPPTVEVTAEREGSTVVVSVSDDGIGIDPDHADRIFDVFRSLHGPDEHEGTGIGLALCERIVERHGGEIWVESEPGEGATFFVTLPAAEGTR